MNDSLTTASRWRGWCYLVRLSWRRQARLRLLVLLSLGLLALMVFVVYVNTQFDRWGMWYWRSPRRGGPMYFEYLDALILTKHCFPWSVSALALQNAVVGAFQVSLDNSGFFVFSNWVVFSIFTGFLLPLWCLTFATDALGREREAGNLIWLLSRPLPRSSIYIAKFIAVLPWAAALNLGGFALLCLAAGAPGARAWQRYWPAVVLGSLAFCSLFHLMGAWFRRPAVVAILYAFFLEMLAGNLPGYVKRASISFYIRCMMFDAAQDYGIGPQRPTVFMPVSGSVACIVLAGLTVGLLVMGMFVFSRKEYLDLG